MCTGVVVGGGETGENAVAAEHMGLLLFLRSLSLCAVTTTVLSASFQRTFHFFFFLSTAAVESKVRFVKSVLFFPPFWASFGRGKEPGGCSNGLEWPFFSCSIKGANDRLRACLLCP